MASNNGGPWGSGGGGNRPSGPGGGDKRGGSGRGGNGRRPGDQPQIPEIDEMLSKGNEYLKVLMGGKGGQNGGGPRGPRGEGPGLSKGTVALGVVIAVGLWAFSSFYTVKPEEQSVELFLGEFYKIGNPGLNFAPWPLVSYEKVLVTGQRTENIGVASGGADSGLMLTTDENIVDIDFQVVWNINDPAKYLFNLAEPRETVQAVSESSMREIIAASELAPILNRDRGLISDTAKSLIQSTLDGLDAGINIVRVNLDKADPPREVIDAFREVQAAEQERDRLERQADAYANTVLARARGSAAQILEEAEGYRAQTINRAQGEASRFSAVLEEYSQAPAVTRKRLYLETIEEVYGDLDKIIIDEGAAGGQGVVPYLPLNELRRSGGTTNGGSN
ncbi:FtsH protease activity modulator HflK [Celeribacter indicus]|uniref:Protein HflK n=1 Tax=Celeribacter indicus TaxID=1208324 RepID=A0A0B5DZ09_9RHOB|nr:FtsH protease activity modulator HflK [Celeribacter indicus]AJE48219.1 Protein HflK [Celeribacter indicus]SDW69822.1 protease FtsH subunit HflK [Celeribacter indicus]